MTPPFVPNKWWPKWEPLQPLYLLHNRKNYTNINLHFYFSSFVTQRAHMSHILVVQIILQTILVWVTKCCLSKTVPGCPSICHGWSHIWDALHISALSSLRSLLTYWIKGKQMPWSCLRRRNSCCRKKSWKKWGF